MNSLNKLGTVLTVIFAVCAVALVVEVLYVLWRRKLFLRRTALSSSGGEVDLSIENASLYNKTPSKELLYFFCWKNQVTRVEPDSGAMAHPPLPPPHEDSEVVDDEVAKWLQLGLYGPSRVLYTIKEEDREEMVTEADENHNLSSTEDQELANANNKMKRKKSNSCDGICVVDDVEVGTTPFWTPCGSPLYHTPSASPSRDGDSSSSVGIVDGVVSGDGGDLLLLQVVSGDGSAVPSVCIEVHAS